MNENPSLYELLDGLSYSLTGRQVLAQRPLSGIGDDSRQLRPGELFVALKGEKYDGHAFLDKAIEKGITAAVVKRGAVDEQEIAGKAVAIAVVEDPRALLAPFAQRFYRNPAAEMTMVGITGTNGKTTVSYLIEQALTRAGFSAGVIGTVEYRYRSRTGKVVARPAPLTTPDILTLNGILREMADNGVSFVVMEVSSHALAQKRLGTILYDLGVFTNLSRDHLDYHRTMEDYFSAKCLLFKEHMAPGASAVVMEQDAEGNEGVRSKGFSERLLELCRALSLKTLRCGISGTADYRISDFSSSVSGVSCRCSSGDGRSSSLDSSLIGRFNIDNLLSSFVCLVELGIDPAVARDSLAQATGAPGRMQQVELAEKAAGQPMLLVDYAHTPDALEKVLTTLHDLEYRSLFCLVGCGGDRDKEKRALMGEIAARLADVVIVTDDNPRSENPALIRQSIISGIAQNGLEKRPDSWLRERGAGERGYLEIGSRQTAIDAALAGAGPGDIVLIAGKGHERYQLVNGQYHFFDDVLAARQSSLRWDFADVIAATGGMVLAGDPATPLKNVCTDSREIGTGDIFVALAGDLFDGHDFLGQAVAGGAGCLVISDAKRIPSAEVCVVEVADTLKAFGDLASYRRGQVKKLSNPIVVGLTGSCGKTTVKEMTAAIFQKRWPDRSDQPVGRVLKTGGNFNNLIGLPLSLLPVSAHHRGVILEMGMNRPGEIARLAEIADPDICCITNVHKAHLAGLGTIEGVAAAKGELFEQSRADAVRVINYDDEHIVRLQRSGWKTLGFAVTEPGLARKPQVWAEDIKNDPNGHLSFVLHVQQQSSPVRINAPGLHNAGNACAAAAIAHAAAIDMASIVAGLQDFRSSSNRMERLRSPGGLNVLNDSYNANPASMASGLRTLAGMSGAHRMAIIGDMLELGEASAGLHAEIGDLAARADLSYLALVGGFAEQISEGALAAGMEPEKIRIFADKTKIIDWLNELLQRGQLLPDDWLLVKASRGLALDTVVDQLMGQRRDAR